MSTKKLNWILGAGYALIMIALMLILGVTKTFSQTIDESSFVAFRYDNIDPLDAPAAVPTVEQLEEDAIDRKMEKYDPKGLPSIENVKKNPIDVIIGIVLPKIFKLGVIEEDTSSFLAHLIKEDWDGSHNG